VLPRPANGGQPLAAPSRAAIPSETRTYPRPQVRQAPAEPSSAPVDHGCGSREGEIKNILVAILAIAAIILLITGGVVPTLNFLLWVGIVLLVIAAIVFLVRYLSRNRTV